MVERCVGRRLAVPCQTKRVLTLLVVLCNVSCVSSGQPAETSGATPNVPPASVPKGIWIRAEELRALPTSGSSWEQLDATALEPIGRPDLSAQEDDGNIRVLAKALVYARTGREDQRSQVIDAIMAAIGTEFGARTLAIGRNLAAYVIAADLVGLPPQDDERFRAWLRELLDKNFQGKTLRTTHEIRPNNWGTHAGASRAAVAAYLGDTGELRRVATVFKGWLGDRRSYAGFKYKDLSWQADPEQPVGINPAGASRDGHSIDGVLPDDQRRGGRFTWPPPKENYVYGALQGALVQAVILSRAGYEDVWEWQDRALLRAFEWLHHVADFPPTGDDIWEAVIIDHFYGTSFWNGSAVQPGKNMGWTDWTHAMPRGDRKVQ